MNDSTSAADLARDLMGAGTDLRVNGDIFAVRSTTVEIRGRWGWEARTEPVLFWVRPTTIGRLVGVDWEWVPVTWPPGARSITVDGVRGGSTMDVVMSRLTGDDPRHTIWTDSPVTARMEKAQKRLRAAAPTIITTTLAREARELQRLRSCMAASPIEETRRAAERIPADPPAYNGGQSLTQFKHAIDAWRDASADTAREIVMQQGEVAAMWLHHTVGNGADSYSRARALGYDIEGIHVTYSVPGGKRDRTVLVPLLTRDGRPVEMPPLTQAGGLQRRGTWSTTYDDALGLVTHAATIMQRGAVPPRAEGVGL